MIDYGYGVSLGAEIPIEAIHWRNEQEIFKWCRQNSLISLDHHNAWLNSLVTDKRVKMFSIHVPGIDDFDAVGVCGLTNIDYIARHAEFSLYIETESQRKGYGEMALKTLIRHGFEDFNLNKIWGETFEGNPAINMFKKLGFSMSPGHPQHYFKQGKYIDTHLAVMLRRDWERIYGQDSSRDQRESQWEDLTSEGFDCEC